jgi:hypothetical protein
MWMTKRQEDVPMAPIEVALKDAMTIDGALGAALVDSTSGMALGTRGAAEGMDLTLAAASTTDVVRANLRVVDALGLHNEVLEEIMVTMTGQYHLIRPLTARSGRGLFLYLVLDRRRANLAMARHQVQRIETGLEI